MRVRRVERVFAMDGDLAFRRNEACASGVDGEDFVPAGEGLGEFEGAVLDELGVESTVGAEVDVFEEDAELGGGDCGSGVGGVYGDYGGLRGSG